MESKIKFKTESPYIEKAKKHVGETYNELTIEEVVGMEYRNGTYRTMVRCRCSCGKEIIAMLSTVLYGNIRSCGHRRKNNFNKFYDGFVDGTNTITIAKPDRIIKTNTSGATGVIKRGNRYRAYIMFKQKQYHLGYFATFEEAVAIRKQAEKDFFGKFLEEHKI